MKPFAALHDRFWEPWRRVWRLAKLRGQIEIDPSCVLTGPVHVLGAKRVRVGRDGYFYRDIHLETQGEGSIHIGDGVVISSGVHLVSFYRIHIGDKAMIGEYCSIRDANHRVGTAEDYRDSGHGGAPIRVGRNVWIGRGSCILAGVEIGENTVVGANSVVTRSLPANCVALGAPARVVKEGLDS